MFHVSRCDLGPYVTLTPQVPNNVTLSECTTTPRVCFSPTVEQCVIGIVGFAVSPGITILGAFLELTSPKQCPTVYYTDEVLFEPDWVSDFHITHEEWALSPIHVKRVGYIDCMKMLREKKVEVIEEPTYINNPHDLVSEYISKQDKQILLRCLEQ